MDNPNTLPGDDVIEYIKAKDLEIKDESFVREKLMLDNKGKIKLAGFLYYVLLVLCLNFSRNAIEFTQFYSSYNMLGIVIIMSLLISQALGLYALMIRHKMAKWVMIGQYIILIIISFLNFNVSSIGFILNSVLMILYFRISKRVKYTFIS